MGWAWTRRRDSVPVWCGGWWVWVGGVGGWVHDWVVVWSGERCLPDRWRPKGGLIARA